MTPHPEDRAAALAALAGLAVPEARSVEAIAAFTRERARLLAIVTRDPRPLDARERAWADAAVVAGAAVVGGAQQLAQEILEQLAQVQRGAHTAVGVSGESTLHRFG